MVHAFFHNKVNAQKQYEYYKHLRPDWDVYLLPGIRNQFKGWFVIYGVDTKK